MDETPGRDIRPAADSEQRGRRTGLLKRLFVKPESLVFAAYAAVTVFMTYPAVTLFTRTYAERKDPLLYLWWSWWFRFSFQNGLPVSPVGIVSAPFGYNWSPYSQEQLTNLSMRGLSIIGGGTFAYNCLILAFFFFTAVAAYYLVKYLTGSRAAGVLSGFVFGFSPYMLMHGKEHISMIAAFCLPVFLLSLLYAWRRKSLFSYALCGGVLIVTALFNSHFGLLASFIFVVFGLTLWLTGKPWRGLKEKGLDRKRLLKGVTVAVLTAGALAALAFLAGKSPIGNPKDLESLYAYSARIWDYFVPHAQSLLMGTLTRDFITRNLHGGFLVESSLFLGFIPMALAAYGTYGNLRRPKNPTGADTNGEVALSAGDRVPGHAFNRRVTSALLVTLAASVIMSLPPTVEVLGVELYMPSYFTYRLLPHVRAYARFGLVAMLCVAVLAGFGTYHLASRVKGRGIRVALVSAFCVLVLLEFTIVPPFVSLDTERPSPYAAWLEETPGDPQVALYPMFYTHDFKNYGYFFEQRLHRKPLVNGAQTDSEAEAFRQTVLDPYNPGTPGVLRAAGTDYVVVIPALYAEGRHLNYPFPASLETRAPPPGLSEVASSSGFVAYRVTAEPSVFLPFFQEGFGQAYVDREGSSWHPTGNRAAIDILSNASEEFECEIDIPARCTRGRCTARVVHEDVVVAESFLGEDDTSYIRAKVLLRPGSNKVFIEADGELCPLVEVPGYQSVSASLLIGDVAVLVAGRPAPRED